MGEWLAPRPGRFTTEKETQYTFYTGLGRPQSRTGQMRKISHPPGFDPRTIHPAASRYTDYAIPAHELPKFYYEFLFVIVVHINLNILNSLSANNY
jgi:hypothetical protein